MTKLCFTTNVRQTVQGPKSRTYYLFDPWCEVEEMDVTDLLSVTVKRGCNCGGGSQTILPLFAREDDIMSGRVVPEWAGSYGAPSRKR